MVVEGLSKKPVYKPCWLGCYIYSYARRHMYENIYAMMDQKEQYQTDTDSVFCCKEELMRHRANNPQLYGEEFG